MSATGSRNNEMQNLNFDFRFPHGNYIGANLKLAFTSGFRALGINYVDQVVLINSICSFCTMNFDFLVKVL